LAPEGIEPETFWRSKLQDPEPTTRPTPNGLRKKIINAENTDNAAMKSSLK